MPTARTKFILEGSPSEARRYSPKIYTTFFKTKQNKTKQNKTKQNKAKLQWHREAFSFLFSGYPRQFSPFHRFVMNLKIGPI